jgi:hypothetical protein
MMQRRGKATLKIAARKRDSISERGEKEGQGRGQAT